MSIGRVLLVAVLFVAPAASQTGLLVDIDAVDRLTGTSLSAGNRFEVLADATETIERKIELIGGARTRILVSTFFLFGHGDRRARRLLDALRHRAASGVEVRVLVDGLLSLVDPVSIGRLERDGVRVATVRYGRAASRHHAKVLVVDDERAVVGGSNLVHEGFPWLPATRYSRWRDTDLLVEGPVAATIAERFGRVWNGLAGEDPIALARPAAGPAALDADGICRFLYNEPGDGDKQINAYLVALFAAARRRIVWQANFLDPSPAIARALVEAAGRGVEVVLLTNGFPVYDRYLGQRREDRFAGTAVRVRRFDGEFDHSKVLVVDEAIAAVGSYNHDFMSSDHDAESLLVVRDRATVAALVDRVEQAIARTRPWDR